MARSDVIVLGAGIAGVSAALQLQKRGRSVVLVDRRGPGEETSYGNAGIIQREGVLPYSFPRDPWLILSYGLNRLPEAHFHWRALPTIWPWLYGYWRASRPEQVAATARGMRPLVERCITEHEPLLNEAWLTDLVRRTGYMRVFRTPQALERALAKLAAECDVYGVTFKPLSLREVVVLEPHLNGSVLAGGVLFPEPQSVSDPGRVVQGYAELFVKRGGELVTGDARTLQEERDGWSLRTERGHMSAADVVVALGAWSDEIFRPLGYTIPLGIKRGYHRHFKYDGDATLGRPVLDAEVGYVLTAMTRGIRLTTGAEFALRDAEPTPVQLKRVTPRARELFRLGVPVEKEPWLGRRPCLPDMLPVIGPAPRHRGLWFDFGHHHLGFTLGPVTGRLLAEMMTGETPFTDPAPYAAGRFG